MIQVSWRRVRPVTMGILAGLAWGMVGCSAGGSDMDLRSPEVLAADRMWSRGGIDEAKAALVTAAEDPASRFAALYRLGLLWLGTDPHKAVDYFAQAEIENPRHPGPVFLSGLARNALNEFDEADLLMKRGYEMARHRLGYALPDTGAAAAEGFLALGRREFAAAAADFVRAREEQGNLAQLYLLEGMALEQARRLDEAGKAVNHALELDAGFAEARVARARLTAMAGDYEGARLELESVLAENPNLASANLQRGYLYLTGSDFRDAALSFWWAVLDDPTRPGAHSAAATTLSRMELAQTAMPVYRNVETINAFLGRYYGRKGFVPRR